MDLKELKQSIAGCNKCALCEKRTNIIFGEGNPNALLMFIGEGPGADEDRLGRPFVGAAGKLLDRILAAAGISRDEIFITNIVKCRPPGNRIPTRAEASACLPYLYSQIEIIKPKIMVLLGSTALQNLIGSECRITKMRGNWLTSRSGIKIMPTYHPAALLRDPSRKNDVWQDFQRVRDEFNHFKSLLQIGSFDSTGGPGGPV